MIWKSIDTVPKDVRVYVWMPGWWAHGPLVPTAWRGYWTNTFDNGSASSNFKPKWWTEIPEGPNG